MLGQEVAQPDHPFLRSSLVRRIRYLMEADEVDAAFQRREQAHQLACMAFRIIESAEDDVLEAEPPLMAPVLLLQECQHLMDAVRLLSRHHRKALIGERVVQADGQVAVALLEEALHTFPYADGRDRDALRAPCPAIGSREQLRGSQYGIQVVHRLALSHEDDVRESFATRHGIDLIQDVRGGKIAAEALPARHAEAASHAASCLTADAERRPVTIGDEDALHLLAALRREEVLRRTIDALLNVARRNASYGVPLLQGRPALEREIGHLVDAPDVLPIEPFSHLLCSKGWHPNLRTDDLQFVKRHSKQLLLLHFAPFIVQMYYILCNMKARKGKKLSFFTSFA